MPSHRWTLDEEQAMFDKEVSEIKAWWESSDKQRQLKRYVAVGESIRDLYDV